MRFFFYRRCWMVGSGNLGGRELGLRGWVMEGDVFRRVKVNLALS